MGTLEVYEGGNRWAAPPAAQESLVVCEYPRFQDGLMQWMEQAHSWSSITRVQLKVADYLPIIHEELHHYHTEILATGSARLGLFSRDTHPTRIPLLGMVELRLAAVPVIALPP